MTTHLPALLLLLASPLAACSDPASPASDLGAAPTDGAGADWQLVWSDEFEGADGAAPDPSKWTFETGGGGFGNGELQHYTDRRENAALQGGRLVLTARKESFQGSAYTSARLKTAGKLAFTYGRVEMSARLPQGQGIWPAFWMLGANIDTGTAWPGCGEIDIMEFVGKTPTRIYGTLHGPGYAGGASIGAWHAEAQGFSGDLHRYAIEWDPGVVRWYFDGRLYQQRSAKDLAPNPFVFDHDFFLLLNLAVGGSFPGPPDNTSVFPQSYQIDYVRVYRRSGPLPPPPTRRLVALKARSNGKFVSADKNQGDMLVADRVSAAGWELFEPVDLGGGASALLALAGYKYVSLTGAGLQASAESVTPGETFTLSSNADGSRSLRSAQSGKYVSVPANGGPLQASASAITAAEEFDLVAQ